MCICSYTVASMDEREEDNGSVMRHLEHLCDAIDSSTPTIVQWIFSWNVIFYISLMKIEGVTSFVALVASKNFHLG